MRTTMNVLLMLLFSLDQAPPMREEVAQAPAIDQAPPVREEGLPAIRPPSSLAASYREAKALAIAQGKPMVVWAGKAICLPCVRANMDEFVMYLPKPSDPFPADSLTIGVPVNGELIMAGQVKEWPDGHIPTRSEEH